MVSEIIEIILEAFTNFLSGVGEGVLSIFNTLVLVKDESGSVIGLTEFATWFLIFGAIGMAWGIFMSLFRLLKRR